MPRFVFVSDTHSNGPRMGKLPDGDVLIHAGDHTNDGGYWECSNALAWFSSHPHRFKFLIPGNHDMLAFCDRDSWNSLLERDKLVDLNLVALASLSIADVWIQGKAASPASERAKSVSTRWGAFQYLRDTGYPWSDYIVEDGLLDLLVTHGPPLHVGDWSYSTNIGCPDLAAAVELRKPKLHVFGHNHEQPGQWYYDGTHYANVSTNHGDGPATVLDFTDGQWHFVSGPSTL